MIVRTQMLQKFKEATNGSTAWHGEDAISNRRTNHSRNGNIAKTRPTTIITQLDGEMSGVD